MDFLKKVETLLNAKTRAVLPHRERRSILDAQEEELMAEIRATLQDFQAVETKERELAQKVKVERAEAQGAAARGDRSEQRAHERRATELEHYLEQESIQAINLEEKLAGLEQKLALAQEAVEKEARKAAIKDAEASKVLAQASDAIKPEGDPMGIPPEEEIIPDDFADDDPDMAARKSRLSG